MATEHGEFSYVVAVAEELHNLSHKYSGRHALDNEKQRFVPLRQLEDFWDDKKLERVVHLSAYYRGSIFLRPDHIRTRFLRVYSLLVVIDRPELIDQFTTFDLDDEVFPIENFPLKWRDTPRNQALFALILEHQWGYFPVIFEKGRLYSQVLMTRRILPIEHEEVIRDGKEVALFRASLEASCTTFAAPENGKVKVVRKQYVGAKRKALFERERKAFEKLQSRPCKHIVECYGSFVQSKPDGELSFSLILEHFGVGNLDEFFKTATPPQNMAQLINFWKCFRGLFVALETIHSTDTDSRNVTSDSQIVHQDIKPQNILISLSNLGASQQTILKIIDFGYSFTRLSSQTHFIDLGGSQTYGPPECSHHGRWRNSRTISITTKADIWSAGCVMSEAGAWIAGGQSLRHSYERARATEAAQRKSIKDAGHGGCFHDGADRLSTVDTTHEAIADTLPPYDNITPRVLALINESMLVPQKDRKDAWEIRERLGKIIEAAFTEERTQVQTPVTPSTPVKKQPDTDRATPSPGVPLVVRPRYPANIFQPQSPPTPPWAAPLGLGIQPTYPSAPNTPPPFSPIAQSGRVGTFSFAEAAKYIEDLKAGRPIEKRVQSVVQQLKDNLGNRDQLFFVDTSESMAEHRPQVTETLRVYGYLAKLMDTNGIDAGFSNDPKPQPYRSTTALLGALKKQRWNATVFENSFGTFINSVIKNLPSRIQVPGFHRTKQQSIFVLTDGCWGSSEVDACGVENPVLRLIHAMESKNLDRTHVAIQFIRFGADEQGMRRLDILDHLGGPFDMDIVDTKPFDYDVWAMFFGPIKADIDKDEERASPAMPTPKRSSLANSQRLSSGSGKGSYGFSQRYSHGDWKIG